MPSPKTKNGNILAFSNYSLAALKAQINQQMAVLKTIKSALNAELADHVIHCVPRADLLIIYTDSSAWASQLRFYRETILSSGSFKQKSIQIKVISPLGQRHSLNKTFPNTPPEEVINQIKNAGLDIGDDKLGGALERLSNTLRRCKFGK